MPSEQNAGGSFAEAVAIMARLRAPGGCPWDREQTFDSIRKYTLEETYEVFDAIERRDWSGLKDELGDLLLQVLFYSEMASEAGDFTISDVVEGLNRKLIRRHPHVFGDEAAAAAGNAAQGLQTEGIDSRQVLRNWEEIKQLEKIANVKVEEAAGRLDGVPRSFPALMEATKLGSKAAKAGFDWPDVTGLFDKLQEEIGEIHAELTAAEKDEKAIAAEIGDLLFTAVNLARHLHVDPEFALRETNAKFRRRFAAMESASEKSLEELSPEALEKLWKEAKDQENSK
ncbi:nucleoside triphosphate pyrophosphohydrolase [Acidobacterium sp. S8]|uniref:nucleoside triphosphate pyrophosphohydrolase n=1 Tax=Acidobacterium sp. S8 TaxID=1641854 RepID=UPI00131CB47B|nr:nucleoside triphosphate pyrophosphohydrolase [Acidobacterium sp. S8]